MGIDLKLIGAMIKAVRQAKGLKVKELAEKLGCEGSYVTNVESGEKLISMEKSLEFAIALEVGPSTIDPRFRQAAKMERGIKPDEEILSEIVVENKPDWGEHKIIRTVADLDPEAVKEYRAEVPILGDIAGGKGIVMPDEEHIEGYALVKMTKARAKTLFAVRVVGDSMNPYIPDGTLVVVDPKIKPGGIPIIGVVRVGDEVCVKEVIVYPDAMRLRSLNMRYEDIYISADIDSAWIGAVVGKGIEK